MIHARNFTGRLSGARLTALADNDENCLLNARKELNITKVYRDYREALRDPEVDVVVIVTPTVLHRDIAVEAAAAGKHIFCEKPMGMNVQECEEMIETADKAKVTLQIGFMRRFDKSFRAAKEQIEAGEIGTVTQVKSTTHGPSTPRPWMLDVKKSNGPLSEVNSHDIDTVRWFTGSEVTEVYVVAGNFRCGEWAEEYPNFYDTLLLVCRFKNGMQGCIDGAASVGYGYDSRAEVLGTDGIIFVGTLRDNSVSICRRGGVLSEKPVDSWRSLFREAYQAEDEAFVEAVREGRQPEVTGFDGLQAVRIVNAGNESIRKKEPIRLDEV